VSGAGCGGQRRPVGYGLFLIQGIRGPGSGAKYPKGQPAMPRIIEIVLFLIPFLSFAAWRLLFPSPTPPVWMLYGLCGFVALMLLALFWLRHIDSGDAREAYIPARLIGGHVVPAQKATQ
jgi:hypothetical protein